MTDMRQDRSDKFKNPPAEGASAHGGKGRGAEREIAEQFETETGHPPGGTASDGRGDILPGDLPPDTEVHHGQHARKGQAESPRELNLNQPEKKREGHHGH